jgi:hypothetical protein
MEQKILNYIAIQPFARQKMLEKIHETIVQRDKSVVVEVEPMMGREMILYKTYGVMKYGLASLKNYMSLHVLPMYGSVTLYSRYKALLPNAKFQKGCINFNDEHDLPIEILEKLIVDCSTIDLKKLREDFLKSRKPTK